MIFLPHSVVAFKCQLIRFIIPPQKAQTISSRLRTSLLGLAGRGRQCKCLLLALLLFSYPYIIVDKDFP